MRRGVEGERQFEHVLEIVRHDAEPAPVRESVGIERDEDAGADREEPEADPGDDERHQRPEGHRRAPDGLRAGEDIDDAAEEDRLGEGRYRERHVGERQPRPDLQVGSELPQNAGIEPDQPHAATTE